MPQAPQSLQGVRQQAAQPECPGLPAPGLWQQLLSRGTPFKELEDLHGLEMGRTPAATSSKISGQVYAMTSTDSGSEATPVDFLSLSCGLAQQLMAVKEPGLSWLQQL